ncbi:unnamed protein product [Ophioblennius macclurei]
MASCSDGEEDLVSFGTPLEPLDEDEPLRRPVPLHEQTVKDDRGRYQRFHGAFTGGFSAGYFNTVGSKEGWTPSTFVSSRQQKAEKQHHARPEDFMDEEDFGEHGIAPAHICRSQEFSSGRLDALAEKKKAIGAQNATIPGDSLLEELIAPAHSSMGMELLRRMGWREGQGVGPRVKRTARRQTTGSGVRGLVPPPAGLDGPEEDEEEFAPENVTFAPKDVTPVDFTPRLSLQGLGYQGLDPGRALLGHPAPEHIHLFRPQAEGRSLFGGAGSTTRRGGVAGEAFGVGALEDDDDEEVYHRDSMSRYDTVLGGEEPGDGLYGWTAPQQYTRKTAGRSRDASYVGKILEGFTLAQKPDLKATVFPPPVLPRDFRPVRRFRPPLDVSALSSVSPALAEALRTSRGRMVPEEPQQGGRHQMDSCQRGALLGEDTLTGPISVLDLLRPEDRQRLLSLRNTSNQSSSNQSSSIRSSSNQSSSIWSSSRTQEAQPLVQTGPVVPGGASASEQQEALAAWRGVPESSKTFRPFEKNPSKQARYESYLDRLKQGHQDALDQSLDSSMTEWERGREREEFVRASILYRPSSSSLASRFTRGQMEDQQDVVLENRDQEGDEEEQREAVKMKMFGAMTRERLEWHPDKLLCKRFNVPHPFPGSGFVGLPKVKRDKFSVFNFLTVNDNKETSAPPRPPESLKKSRWDVSGQRSDLPDEPPFEPPAAPPVVSPSVVSSRQTEVKGEPADQQSSSQEEEEDGKKEEEEEEDEEEEESRPPMDLFKAIFEGSSDDKSSSSEEDEEEEEQQQETHTNTQPLNLFTITSSSSLTTSSALPSSQPTKAAAPPQTSLKEEEEVFGPKLPPPSAAPLRGGVACQEEAEPSTRRSREMKQKSKKQHKHKKEKKKKKHKKNKHRAKERKRSKEEEEEKEVSAEELLRRLKSVS